MSEAEKKVKERYPDAECVRWSGGGVGVVAVVEAGYRRLSDKYARSSTAAWQSALERMEKQ